MGSAKGLSLNEWAVLGFLAEGETHGFAASRAFAATGPIGKIWTIPRPLVYRAVTSLVARGLAAETGLVPGSGAPMRRVVHATEAGRAAVAAWLFQPVAHVRDARSELLMKLLLLERAALEPGPLLVAQRELVEPMLASLHSQLEQSSGFDSTIIRWRIYSAEALARFLDDVMPDRLPPVS